MKISNNVIYDSPIIIHTDEPSSGKPIVIGAKLTTLAWITLAQAPLFTVPLSSDEVDEAFTYVTEEGENRELILGEVLLNAPLIVVNSGNTPVDIYIQLFTEDSIALALTPLVTIPVHDAAQIALQGQVLTKTDPSLSLYGDRLQIKASVANVISVYGSGAEGASAVHARDTESVA